MHFEFDLIDSIINKGNLSIHLYRHQE